MTSAREVAQRAGVSVSTVSRALQSPERVSAVTRERVVRAARELGYRPDPVAQGLRLGRTRALGLLVPDFENPFFASVTKGVQARARAAGYAVFVADSDEDGVAEPDLVAGLAERVDGLVLASPRSTDRVVLGAVGDVPTVLVSREMPGLPSVSADDGDGMAQALGHLHALGHRRVAVATGPESSWSGARRLAGAAQAAERFGVEVVELGSFAPHFSGGLVVADHVVASGASALVAFNDLMALGVLDRLAARGVRVPQDVSVVGFDDVGVATLVSPALTTVRQPLARLGRTAVDLLLARVEGTSAEPTGRPQDEVVRLPVELVSRASTGVVREAGLPVPGASEVHS